MLRMKKFPILVLGVYAGYAFSAPPLSQEQIREQNKAYLKKMGIEMLDGEVRIIDAKTLKSQANDEFYATRIKQYLSMHKEQEKNGFVNAPSPRAKELLEFSKTADFQYEKYKNELSPSSTHIRHTIAELKMAYTFVGVPASVTDKTIGFAPYGAYKQTKYGDDGDGWDGAIQFFQKKDVGTCEFKEHNMKLAHGGVELIKELVSEDIAGKPTIVLVKGNEQTGFTYQINWYDNTYSRELTCAATSYQPSTKDKVISLAKLIESSQ
ncbi:hypothetical protein [Legionella clemsonensis]|uniref:Uncharacterized protein n=1 Tax=Legionella clemsonensis TaxID=1867846 RepID=A0A222NZL2_9GAMM|nr:hypothetical protein [Legionella clemsonensis]ASQ44985.1 hypothetical protein clem_02110 [Legionella clemsonensis]